MKGLVGSNWILDWDIVEINSGKYYYEKISENIKFLYWGFLWDMIII